MYLIAIGHVSRTGKDTFADYLYTSLSAKGARVAKASLAYELKRLAHQLYSNVGLLEPEAYEGPKAVSKDLPNLKNGMSPRDVWIFLGEKLRQIDPDVWVHALKQKCVRVDYLIVPDARHPNECQAADLTIRVDRPGVVATNDVDKQLLGYGFDIVVHNDGTLEDLQANAGRIADGIYYG